MSEHTYMQIHTISDDDSMTTVLSWLLHIVVVVVVMPAGVCIAGTMARCEGGWQQ